MAESLLFDRFGAYAVAIVFLFLGFRHYLGASHSRDWLGDYGLLARSALWIGLVEIAGAVLVLFDGTRLLGLALLLPIGAPLCIGAVRAGGLKRGATPLILLAVLVGSGLHVFEHHLVS